MYIFNIIFLNLLNFILDLSLLDSLYLDLFWVFGF